MASRLESGIVYAAGAVQGIVLVTFPAASTIFTSPTEYDLSSTRYGILFLPQVLLAIAASLGGAWLGRRIGLKKVYLAGLASGVGPLMGAGHNLPQIYRSASLIAVAVGLLSFAVRRRSGRRA